MPVDTNISIGDESNVTISVSDDNLYHLVKHPPVVDISPSDIYPTLDYIEDEDNGRNESDDDPGEVYGVQQKFIEAIQKRIQREVSGACQEEEKWLSNQLVENDWWIRKAQIRRTVKKLKLELSYLAYYREVYVWLPDVRWASIPNTFMPCCPNCISNHDVGPHSFRDNHFGRVVVGLSETYYIVSRRYICHTCQRMARKAKNCAEDLMKKSGATVDTVVVPQYTFMGWDKRILPLFDSDRGDYYFPAVLTWKAGVDKEVVNMMRPLFNDGMRPEALSKLLLELHSKQFTRLCIQHEHEIAERKKIHCNREFSPLGDFGDKWKYRGLVPTGKFLAHIYKVFHASIGEYLDMEVKKRGADFLHWDVSYKEAKHLSRYHGEAVFKGLVTAMNELGEVRIQFHVYSDSHDQMKSALEAFRGTTTSLGLPDVRIFFTDNPAGDKQFYTRMLPSLQRQQDLLDDLCQSNTANPMNVNVDTSLPTYPYENLLVRESCKSDDIDDLVRALKENIKGKNIGLDAEWNRTVNARGMQIGNSKVHIIQVAYRNSSDQIVVLLLKVGGLTRLPQRLEHLIANQDVDIFGANVSADLTKIARDFHVVEMKKVDQKTRQNVHNLGLFARKRDVVQDGSASLELIVKSVLNIALDKTLQCSDWGGTLSPEQKQYAAIDAAASLEVGEKLLELPDLTRRLQQDVVSPGKLVDLVPRNGSTACMATRSATATITSSGTCTCPPGMVYGKKKFKQMRAGEGSCVIALGKIYSPALIVPSYMWAETKTPVTLEEFPDQAEILVPISMIKEHVAMDTI